MDERLALLKRAAGERFAHLELNALVQRVIVTDDRRREAADLARERWSQLTVEDILETPYALIGTVDGLVEDLIARRKRWGISNYLVHEPYLDVFAPVVAHFAGT